MRVLLTVVLGLLIGACAPAAEQAPQPTPIVVYVTPEPTSRPAPAPWPDGWASEFCYAIDQLGDANGHMLEASNMGAAFDFDGAVEEAEMAAQDAREAGDALAIADEWPPAHSAVVYLSSAAEEMRKAANLLKLGAQSIDVSLIEEAIKHQEKANYQLGRASTAADALIAKYGAPC